MVANPKKVGKDKKSTIGWITKGMRSCVVASADPDHAAWNTEQSKITNVSGVAKAPDLDKDTEFILTCTTNADQKKEARVKVEI